MINESSCAETLKQQRGDQVKLWVQKESNKAEPTNVVSTKSSKREGAKTKHDNKSITAKSALPKNGESSGSSQPTPAAKNKANLKRQSSS